MVESVNESQAQESADSRLGMNVRMLREQKRMTQSALAEAMTARGWQWHQSTVARVESGQQSVRFAEAEALVKIFGVTLDRLTYLVAEAAELALAQQSNTRLRESWMDAETAIVQLEAARAGALHHLKGWQNSRYERVREWARGLAEDLESDTVESAVAEGIEKFKRLASGARPD